jgi:hypothetical protein
VEKGLASQSEPDFISKYGIGSKARKYLPWWA